MINRPRSTLALKSDFLKVCACSMFAATFFFILNKTVAYGRSSLDMGL